MSRLIIQNAFILYNAASRAGASSGKATAAERPEAGTPKGLPRISLRARETPPPRLMRLRDAHGADHAAKLVADGGDRATIPGWGGAAEGAERGLLPHS